MAKTKEERRNEIIETAGKLFEEKGYEQTQVQDIVNEIGVASLCQVLVGKFPYLFLLSLFFYFFVSQTSPDYALNRYFFFSCQV